MALKSESISNKLLFLIYGQIGCVLIGAVRSILELTSPDIHAKYSLGFGICAAVLACIILALFVVVPIWIYRVHKDMCGMFADYPITPGKSMKMTLIPIYNAWGFWKMAKELYDTFRFHGLSLKFGPFDLQSLYILVAVLGAVDQQMTKFSVGQSYELMSLQNKLIYEITYSAVSLSATALWYIIVNLVAKGLAHLHEEMSPNPSLPPLTT